MNRRQFLQSVGGIYISYPLLSLPTNALYGQYTLYVKDFIQDSQQKINLYDVCRHRNDFPFDKNGKEQSCVFIHDLARYALIRSRISLTRFQRVSHTKIDMEIIHHNKLVGQLQYRYIRTTPYFSYSEGCNTQYTSYPQKIDLFQFNPTQWEMAYCPQRRLFVYAPLPK